MDLVAALHWVQANIADVAGGDAGNVTLVGHDASAALVNLLMLSPMARGQSLCLHSLCLPVFAVCLLPVH